MAVLAIFVPLLPPPASRADVNRLHKRRRLGGVMRRSAQRLPVAAARLGPAAPAAVASAGPLRLLWPRYHPVTGHCRGPAGAGRAGSSDSYSQGAVL